MSKRLKLPTRAFGAEPHVPDIAALSDWIADNRGTAADLTTYRLTRSLAPQLEAGIGFPCAGGLFMQDRILECMAGAAKGRVTDELSVRTGQLAEDGYTVAAMYRNGWCALPAPHRLGLADAYYHDDEEWSDALNGFYATVMRTMRDAGVYGTVLIGDRADVGEIAALADQKVFFFLLTPDRKSLATLMEYQRQVAVDKDHIRLVFDLMDEYTLQKLCILDPDPEAIRLARSRLDPDQIVAAGYCTKECDAYWKDVAEKGVCER